MAILPGILARTAVTTACAAMSVLTNYVVNPYQAPSVAAVALEFLSWRERWMEKLKQRGVMCLEVFPEELTAALINQYLEIKAGHLL